MNAWRQVCKIASSFAVVAVAAASVLLCTGSLARAEPGKTGPVDVTLEVAPCVRVDSARVRQLFALELATSHANAAQAAKGARAQVRCKGELIELSVHDPLTRKTLSRTIEPGPPAGRDRLIALAVLELLVASWVELETTPEPVGQPPKSRSNAAAEIAARALLRRRAPQPSWTTTITASTGALLAEQLHLGGGVRVQRSSSKGWGYAFDLLTRRASEELTLGDVTVASVSSSASMLLTQRVGQLALSGGLGLRGAIVSLTGQAGARPGVTAAEVTGFAGGPLLMGSSQLVLSGGFTLGLSAEVGYHVFEVSGTVDGDRETGTQGPWVATSLEAGWAF